MAGWQETWNYVKGVQNSKAEIERQKKIAKAGRQFRDLEQQAQQDSHSTSQDGELLWAYLSLSQFGDDEEAIDEVLTWGTKAEELKEEARRMRDGRHPTVNRFDIETDEN